MKNIYIKDLIKICNGKLLSGSNEIIIKNICTDTRKIKENDIYVGIKGEVYDGNTMYEEAFQKGALAVILDNIDNIELEKYKDKTIIYVENTIKCLQQLATYKRSLYDIPVIAITGSVGKTSTKDMIYEVVNKKYNTLKTEANLNNHIGLPLTILKLDNHEALIVEMGMNHLGEISILTNIAKPTIAVITNVGTAHIGNLGSRENILKAKLEITEGLNKNGTLIINNDNDLLHNAYPTLKEKYDTITIGIDNNSVYNAKNIEDNVFSSNFKINNQDYTVNVGGNAFIYNSLVAYAVGKKLNIDEKSIIEAIKEFKLSPHRLEKKTTQTGITIIDDTYNANMDSMINALKILAKVNDKRRVAILADMLELGEYTKEIHQTVGKEITENTLDILITVGENSKYIKKSAITNNFPKDKIYSYNNYQELIPNLNNILKPNDIVLLKGSHSMNLTKAVEYLTQQ